MIRVDEKGNIEITRGDSLPLAIKANNKDGSPYIFEPNDVVRFSVTVSGNCDDVVLRQDMTVAEECQKVNMFIPSEKMKFGDVISKPKKYWYEVEVNPDTPNTKTIIGYTKKEGPKLLILTPESGDSK